MKKFPVYLFLLLAVLFITACKTEQQPIPLKIALSKALPVADYPNYYRWLKSVDSTIIFYEMYHLEFDSAMKALEVCDGLLLTGGTDVYPGRFGKEADTGRVLEPDFKRDSLEFALLTKACKMGIPVQGVCRGLQLINVHFGGSLIIDIPTDIDTVVKHQLPDTYDCPHYVEIVSGSLLHEVSGLLAGTTNSNHHQGIDVLGLGLEAMAKTNDGLIESIGFIDRENKSYLMAVQWHPERLDYTNPLSGPIVKRFVEEAGIYANNRRHENK